MRRALDVLAERRAGERRCEKVREKLAAAEAEVERLRGALRWLVEVIDKAGLLNLSRGVQLGRTSWYVKASDALEAARAAMYGEEEK